MQYTMSAALSGFLKPQYLWYEPEMNNVTEDEWVIMIRMTRRLDGERAWNSSLLLDEKGKRPIE